LNTSFRRYIIHTVTGLVAFVFLAKLFFLQIIDEEYKLEAQNNVIQKVIDYPDRGMIKDRNGKLIVANMPAHDILIIPKEFRLEDTIKFCQLFNLTKEELIDRYKKLKKLKDYSPYKPMPLIKHLPEAEFIKVQDRLDEFKGVYAGVRTIRQYPHASLANALGYVKEVDKVMLDKDTTKYYQQGDLIGKSGVEASYEEQLRGKRGVNYVMVNAKRMVKDKFEEGKYDIEAEVGQNLTSSIDLDLQQYSEVLMSNKIGSIVAIEPNTGEILTMVSAPSYNPNLLTGNGKEVSNHYFELLNNRFKPLYNRPAMASYPPGSIFKLVQALIGLEEGVIDTTDTHISCIQDVVKCHGHGSPLNLHGSIQHSCNPFYYKVFNRIIIQEKSKDYFQDSKIGLDNWHSYVSKFGFGQKLGSDIPEEKAGNMPSSKYYDKRYKQHKWKFGNIYSLSIGQGEMGVTPLQMANMAATIANRGYFYTPHLVKDINGKGALEKYKEKHNVGIKKEYFNFVANAMADVVRAGTARKAQVPNITVCGKTGTAQNPHGEDHSVFICFAPKDNPKIAIAVYVENAGWGGSWAAPIASLMIEKYLKGKIEDPARLAMEKQIIEKDFITPRDMKMKRLELLDSLNRAVPVKNQSVPTKKNENITTAIKSEDKSEGIKKNDD
jgi:penicillin-binding protein 2